MTRLSFKSTRFLLFALALLLLAFALRMWHLNTESIWHDEAWSIRAIHGPFTTPDDNTPFIYYFSGHLLWRLGGGDTPLALRYISVLWGVLTVAAALRVGRRWTGTGPGLAFGLIVATSPLLWEYAQEVRAYVVVPLIALALLALADRILQQRQDRVSPRLWAAICAVQIVGLYTHNLTVPLIVWLNGVLGLAWLLGRHWRRMITWAGLQIMVIIAYIPWLLTQSPSGTPLNTPPEPGLTLIRDVWYSYFLPALTQFEQAVAGSAAGIDLLPVLNGLGLTVIILGIMSSIMRLDQRNWLLMSHVVGVPLFTTALMLAAHIDFHPRYYIASVPGTLLLLVYSLAQIRPFPVQRVALAVATIICLGMSGISLHQITTTRTYQHDDFASLAAYYDSLPADAVILIPFDDEPALQYYFDRVLDIDAQMVNIPLYSDEATAIEMINALNADHIELLTWFQLPADARGMYPCLLTAASTMPPGDPQTYFGLMTQRFTIADITLTPIAANPVYNALTLEGAAFAASAYGTCVRTAWTLQQTTAEALQVAATLLNPFGEPMTHNNNEIVRDDSEIARDDNASTTAWGLDDVGAAYNLLMLPEGVPIDAYALTLNVYSDGQPSGFDLLDAAGNPAGVNFTVADVIETSGPPVTVDTAQIIATNTDTPRSGETLHITLLVPNGPVQVTLSGETWAVEQMATSGRNWLRFDLPADASGSASLQVDGEAIASYPVEAVERILQPPEFEAAINTTFDNVGSLAGASIASAEVSPAEPPQVTLIWQGASDADLDYTVFVQLISPDGQVIAQSDSPPVNGQRPTTTWVDGEYIIDTHTLRFNLPDYRGSATIIAGLYNPDGFQRVPTLDGGDHARLPFTVTLEDD